MIVSRRGGNFWDKLPPLGLIGSLTLLFNATKGKCKLGSEDQYVEARPKRRFEVLEL